MPVSRLPKRPTWKVQLQEGFKGQGKESPYQCNLQLINCIPKGHPTVKTPYSKLTSKALTLDWFGRVRYRSLTLMYSHGSWMGVSGCKKRMTKVSIGQ